MNRCYPVSLLLVVLLTVVMGCGGGGGGNNGRASSNSPAPQSYTFTQLAGPTLWTQLARTLAVDDLDHAYVTDGSAIFRVDNTGPSVYLDADTIAAAIGGGASASSLDIRSLDIGPDGKIYFLDRWNHKIMISAGAGKVMAHRDLSDITGSPWFIGVPDPNNILLINLYDEMWSIRDTGNVLLYDQAQQVQIGTDCAKEGLAVFPDGNFAYLPGCNGSPLVSGKADGTSVGILLTNDIDVGLNSYWNFAGIGRDSAGSFVVNIGGSRIVRVTSSGQYELIHTDPELDSLSINSEGNEFSFINSPIAVGPTGSIYIISTTSIYVAK